MTSNELIVLFSNTYIHNNIPCVTSNKLIGIYNTNIHNNILCVNSNKLIVISNTNIHNNILCVTSNNIIVYLILIFLITYYVSLAIS